MDENILLKELCKKEVEYGLYESKIEGLSIYSLIRHRVRYKYIEMKGMPAMEMRSTVHLFAAIRSAIISFFQLFKLWLSQKTYSTVFYAFPRVDKIGDVYFDKFTDPVIDVCDLKLNYIILDHGRAGIHPRPRAHHRNIIYTDFLEVCSVIYASCFYHFFYNKFKNEFDRLHVSIVKYLGVDYEKKEMVKHYYISYVYSNLLKRLFKHVSSKRVLGPARALLYTPFFAAHRIGMQTFELQHGVTYGESVLYSGYRDPKLIPDLFLAFGDNKPSDVYGIGEDRIVNIGWALNNYIGRFSTRENYQERDVLVISDPEITEKIIAAVVQLADNNPDSTFYLRLHPHEIINDKQLSIIESKKNVRIQNKTINISIVLQAFNHVIGEDSTVLYEALAVNKKVGKLFMGGLKSHYLEDADRDCFWEIHSQNDFKNFINGDVNERKSKCIYSLFNKDLFCKTIGIET